MTSDIATFTLNSNVYPCGIAYPLKQFLTEECNDNDTGIDPSYKIGVTLANLCKHNIEESNASDSLECRLVASINNDEQKVILPLYIEQISTICTSTFDNWLGNLVHSVYKYVTNNNVNSIKVKSNTIKSLPESIKNTIYRIYKMSYVSLPPKQQLNINGDIEYKYIELVHTNGKFIASVPIKFLANLN